MPDGESLESRFRSEIPFRDAAIPAAAVYCSDGRFGDHFEDFLRRGLELPRYDRIAVPGGPACLAEPSPLRPEAEVVVEQLRFLIEAHQLEKVVLIAHVPCAFYEQRLGVPFASMVERQLEDLWEADRLIRGFASVQIEAYIAEASGDVVDFRATGV
jgi:hypothetical protein